MGDPRNVAHAKKVVQEKHHKHKDGATAPQRGNKAQLAKQKQAVAEENPAPKTAEAARPAPPPDPTQLEKSLVVLSKLKELEFHSRGNIEKLRSEERRVGKEC